MIGYSMTRRYSDVDGAEDLRVQRLTWPTKFSGTAVYEFTRPTYFPSPPAFSWGEGLGAGVSFLSSMASEAEV